MVVVAVLQNSALPSASRPRFDYRDISLFLVNTTPGRERILFAACLCWDADIFSRDREHVAWGLLDKTQILSTRIFSLRRYTSVARAISRKEILAISFSESALLRMRETDDVKPETTGTMLAQPSHSRVPPWRQRRNVPRKLILCIILALTFSYISHRARLRLSLIHI